MRQLISIPAALLIGCTLLLGSAHAQTTTPAQHPTQPQTPGQAQAQRQPVDVRGGKERIATDYRNAKAACNRLAGNTKDICVEEAKGAEKVALAELEYSRTGSAEDQIKVALAKADAAYEVAKERCDDKSGNDKDVCRKEAKAAEVRAKADARANSAGSEARSDAAADVRDAEYKVAVERCDAMSGDAKSACVDAAKRRYGKN